MPDVFHGRVKKIRVQKQSFFARIKIEERRPGGGNEAGVLVQGCDRQRGWDWDMDSWEGTDNAKCPLYPLSIFLFLFSPSPSSLRRLPNEDASLPVISKHRKLLADFMFLRVFV